MSQVLSSVCLLDTVSGCTLDLTVTLSATAASALLCLLRLDPVGLYAGWHRVNCAGSPLVSSVFHSSPETLGGPAPSPTPYPLDALTYLYSQQSSCGRWSGGHLCNDLLAWICNFITHVPQAVDGAPSLVRGLFST